MMGRDVVDTTGLSGKFDFHIQYHGEMCIRDRYRMVRQVETETVIRGFVLPED